MKTAGPEAERGTADGNLLFVVVWAKTQWPMFLIAPFRGATTGEKLTTKQKSKIGVGWVGVGAWERRRGKSQAESFTH